MAPYATFLGLVAALAVGVVDATFACKYLASPPAHSVCRKRGTLSNPADLGFLPATITSSLDACRHFAHEQSNEASFSWHHLNKHCHFYTSKIADMGFVANASSPLEFTDKSCSNCTAICPTPSGVNQIGNPGFEASNKYIGPWYSFDSYSVESPGENSSNALRITMKDGGSSLGSVYQFNTQSLCSGTEYLLTIDSKFTPSTDFPAASYYSQALGAGFDMVFPKRKTSWTSISLYVAYQARDFYYPSYTLSVSRGSGKGSLVWEVDNWSLLPVAKPSVVPGAKERLVNGGFESGKAAPWTFSQPWYTVVSPGFNGSKFALSTIPPKGTEDESATSSLRQDVSLKKGSHYLLTLDYYNSLPKPAQGTGARGYISLMIGPTNSSSPDATDVYTSSVELTTKGYGTYRRRFIALQNATRLTINLEPGFLYTPNGTVYSNIRLDNISLKEAAKPGGGS